MSSGKVKCTCGWSWNKSDSSKKDMYICHECGRDNSNNMENGGWLDSYEDGGTMQEHQENYNDSSVSLPEGFVGEGYDITGRNYSPAWGGQFEDGGLIPMAQNGRATRADSLAVYNNAKKVEDFYNSKNYKLLDSKKHYYLKGDEEDYYGLKQVLFRDRERWIEPDWNETEPIRTTVSKGVRKNYNLEKNRPKNFKDIYSKKIDKNKIIQRERSNKLINLDAPPQYFDFRIQPQTINSYRDVSKGTPTSNDKVEIYKYDPLAVKPFNMLTDAEKKLRVEKYGTDGVPKSYINASKNKLNKDPKPDKKPNPNKKLNLNPKPKQEVVQPDLPMVEAVNLPPMQQLQSINPPAISDVVREPKSYNVSRKTYNMKGLNDYYTTDEEGVDYERAMLQKSAADAYNRDILKRYGPQNEYRTPKSAADAAERLKELRSEFEITPNYQMGGSVYPVNYVPEAQWGLPVGPLTPLALSAANKVKSWWNDDEPVKPIKKPATQGKARTLNIVDPRKKMATTNQPLRPNSDLVGGKYNSNHLDKLMQEAKRQKLSKQDMMTLSAMGFQETKWGKSDGNIGHVIGNWKGNDHYQKFISAYKEKMKEADRLGIKDPATRLQVYNGMGTVTPKTEKNYHGFEMQKIYGVPIPKGGINMKKNPLYGKQVMDIRDNVLAKNSEYLQYMDSIYKAPVPAYIQDVRMNKQKPPKNIQGRPQLIQPLLAPLKKKEMGGSIPGAVGFSYARTQSPAPSNGKYAKKTMASAKDGEIIKDDMGQWAHPGEITEIDSPYITMEGVPYPVLGISDTGDMQMMYPEEDYEFDGESVTEYPMAKNGIRQEQKGLVNLDQLTNFTNYNTKQPGGWLDKY